MKALSVKQPYADWITSGRKTIEIRSWPTEYRGDLLIVSSRQPAKGYSAKDYLLGQALCIVRLVHCRPMTENDTINACCPFFENCWSWELEAVKQIHPFAVKGQLRLFEVDYTI